MLCRTRLALLVLVLGASFPDAAALGGEGDGLKRKGAFRGSSLVSLKTSLARIETHALEEVTGTRDDSFQTIRKLESSSGVKSKSDSGVMVAILILVPVLAFLIFFLVYMNADDGVMQPISRSKGEAVSRASPLMSGSSATMSQGRLPVSGVFSDSVVRQSAHSQSSTGIEDARGNRTLCANFVITRPEGVRLSVPLELLPEPQSMTLDISSITDGGRVIARAVIQERFQECGLLLETTGHTAIAFLDTTFAQVTGNSTGLDSRYVILRQAMGGNWDDGGAPFAVFFVSRGKHGATLVARSGDATGRSRPFLSALVGPDGTLRQLTDAQQRVLAESEPVVGGSREVILKVYQGTDASLVLCAMFAASKLA